jgi:opacity protein-like surface antigen
MYHKLYFELNVSDQFIVTYNFPINKKMKNLLLTFVTITLLGTLCAIQQASAAHMPYARIELGYSFLSGLKYSHQYGESNLLTDAEWEQTTTTAITNAADADASDSRSNEVKRGKGVGFGVGIGRSFNNSLRGDVSVMYAKMENKPSKTTSSDTSVYDSDFYVIKDDIRALVNIYWDMHISTDFAPFVGIGVGTTHNQYKIKILGNTGTPIASTNETGDWNSDPSLTKSWKRYLKIIDDTTFDPKTTKTTAGIDSIKGKSQWDLAYQATIGIGYQVSDGFYLDMGYRMENCKEFSEFTNDFMKQEITVSGAALAATPHYTAYRSFKVKPVTKSTIYIGMRTEF